MLARYAPPTGLCAESDRLRAAARAPSRTVRFGLLTLLALCLGAAYAASREPGFSRSVTPGLVQGYAARFGPDSEVRIRGWQKFVRSAAATPPLSGNDLELLGPVNTFVNRIPFIDDLTHWRLQDYWASPAESFASNGADCEDFSIAKYFVLKELGVPIRRLRITYVKAVRLNQAHMVLAYYAEPNAMPLIMDNLDERVRPASERDDLIPVYSFNDEDLLVVRPGRRDASAGSALQIRLWRGLQDKLARELLY
jgi:predicted transglutaminase-like cysteine proteinase